MKRLLYTICAVLMSIATYGQAKLSQDSTAGANLQSSPSIQWSRNLLYGKPLYYIYDAKTGKTLPIYSAQLANYIFLGKDEAVGMYVPYAGANANIIPQSDAIINLGSSAKRINNLYSVFGFFQGLTSIAYPGGITYFTFDNGFQYSGAWRRNTFVLSSTGDLVNTIYTGTTGATLETFRIVNTTGVIKFKFAPSAPSLVGSINDSLVTHNTTTGQYNVIAPATPINTFVANTIMSRDSRGATGVQVLYLGGVVNKKMALGTDSSGAALYIQGVSNTAPASRLLINGRAFTSTREITFRDKSVTVADIADPISTFTNDAGYQTQASADARYPQSAASYANPSWITALAYSKLTGAPTLGTLAAKNNGDILASSITGNAATASNSTQLNGQPGSYYYPASNPNGFYKAGDDVSLNTVNLTTAKTVINASIAGSVTCIMPFRGASYKKVLISRYNGNATYTFPIAFSSTPLLTGLYSGTLTYTSLTATSITLSGNTGDVGSYWAVIEGY